MQQASQNNYILDEQYCGNVKQQRYYLIINCFDKIARTANLNELTKIQKLNKYENLKNTFGTSNLNIQVPLDIVIIKNESFYIEYKYDCDVEQLIKIDAFNLEAFPQFIYGMFSALNQLHQKGIKHGNIDTFSIGYYSKRGQYIQQFVLMDFGLIDRGRTANLKNEESQSQDYHDLAKVFLNILLKQQNIPNINHNDQLQKLKQSKEFNKYYDIISRMLTNKKFDPQWLLDQLNDSLKPQLIIDQSKFQNYQMQQMQLKYRSFNINGFRQTNPTNLLQNNQQFTNQINRQSLPNNLQVQLTNNPRNNQIFKPNVIQQNIQQLQLVNKPQIGRPQLSQTNLQIGQQVPTQIQTISSPQNQFRQPIPQQPNIRQIQGFSNQGVVPLRQQQL